MKKTSVYAKLFIQGVERELLSTNVTYKRGLKESGKPATELEGGHLTVSFISQMYDDFFLEWIIAHRMFDDSVKYPYNLYKLKKGKIVFYEDALCTIPSFEYVFRDATLINYKEEFNNQTGMVTTLTISPAIQEYNNTLFVKLWNESWVAPSSAKPHKVEEGAKNPRIINGWWSKDRGGKEPINRSNLGETVYFHVETRDIKEGSVLDLKLYDLDAILDQRNLVADYFSPDDDEFDKKEVHQSIKVNGKNIATAELFLHDRWEKDLKEDTAYNLELYWEVNYKDIRKDLPKQYDDYLRVDFSKRTLYFKPSIAGGKLPQLIAEDGSPLFLLELKKAVGNKVEGVLKDKLESKIPIKGSISKGISNTVKGYNKAIDNKVTTIALAKLAKGNMIDNAGKLHTKPRKLYEYSEEVFGKETIVKRGKNFSNGKVSSKGINQAHYFATNGRKVEILNAMRINPIVKAEEAGDILENIFNSVKFSTMSLEEITSQPFSTPDFLLKHFLPSDILLGIGLWVDFLGYVALVEHEKQNTIVDQAMGEMLELAKTKGLSAVRDFLHTYDTDYILVPISNKTLSELLIGKFKTLKEVRNYDKKVFENKNIHLLIREDNKNPVRVKTIVESIFFK